MTVIVETRISHRLDRVVKDICTLQHDKTAAAQARALRWVAHVLNDINARRKWWFLERPSSTMLGGGEDVVELTGHIDKPVAVYAGEKRLKKASLARVSALRQAALAAGAVNAGAPTLYALERTTTGLRVHLWPAPGASASAAFTADAGTDALTVASNTVLATGRRVRVATTGTLPGALAADTTYYLIRVDATTLKLAASLAAAQAGTAIDLTSAGTGSHTLRYGLTPFAILYTRPMDLAIVPDHFETVVLNGVLGTFGRHFDRDQLGSDPESFELRYEQQLRRAHTDSWDTETVERYEEDLATELGAALSESEGAVSHLVPASLTGIGYVTIETGDYPLEVG